MKKLVAFVDAVVEQRELARDYLDSAQVVRANKSEFSSPTQAEWANDFAIQHPTGKYPSFSTRVGARAGIGPHPWMHILPEYNPSVTLNVAEMESLQPTASFFQRQLSLYRNSVLVMAPFPDTPRLPAEQVHIDGFANIVHRANLNPDDYRLHYVRYYVMSVAGTNRPAKVQPLIAHAYTRRDEIRIKENCHINYSLIS
jgi:hypothetical protein